MSGGIENIKGRDVIVEFFEGYVNGDTEFVARLKGKVAPEVRGTEDVRETGNRTVEYIARDVEVAEGGPHLGALDPQAMQELGLDAAKIQENQPVPMRLSDVPESMKDEYKIAAPEGENFPFQVKDANGEWVPVGNVASVRQIEQWQAAARPDNDGGFDMVETNDIKPMSAGWLAGNSPADVFAEHKGVTVDNHAGAIQVTANFSPEARTVFETEANGDVTPEINPESGTRMVGGVTANPGDGGGGSDPQSTNRGNLPDPVAEESPQAEGLAGIANWLNRNGVNIEGDAFNMAEALGGIGTVGIFGSIAGAATMAPSVSFAPILPGLPIGGTMAVTYGVEAGARLLGAPGMAFRMRHIRETALQIQKDEFMISQVRNSGLPIEYLLMVVMGHVYESSDKRMRLKMEELLVAQQLERRQELRDSLLDVVENIPVVGSWAGLAKAGVDKLEGVMNGDIKSSTVLMQELQHLFQMLKVFMELISNMSKNIHDMAMTPIRNLR